MTTFVLVHGAWHGAWCWERLIGALSDRGQRAVAVDLPVDDPTAGTSRYAEIVQSAMPVDDDVVLVGHSLGATVIPLVVPALRGSAPRLPMSGAPPPRSQPRGSGGAGQRCGQRGTERGKDLFDDESSAWEPAAAIDVFYHDCDDATAKWAASRLRRQYWRYWEEPNPLHASPATEYQAIVCRDDKLAGLMWARRVLPAELGVTPLELDGGHSPFLSRPTDLADALLWGNAH